MKKTYSTALVLAATTLLATSYYLMHHATGVPPPRATVAYLAAAPPASATLNTPEIHHLNLPPHQPPPPPPQMQTQTQTPTDATHTTPHHDTQPHTATRTHTPPPTTTTTTAAATKTAATTDAATLDPSAPSNAASAPACDDGSTATAVGAPFAAADFSGHFLMARLPSDAASAAVGAARLRRLLKSLIGLARSLERTLVLPAELCDCPPSGCDGVGAAPFDCAPRLPLSAEAWTTALASSLPKGVRPSRFSSAAFPDELRTSHVRVLLPKGMSEDEAMHALRQYKETRLLELDDAADAFCGYDLRVSGNARLQEALVAATAALLGADDGGDGPAAALHHCAHPRGGTGEVLQFENVGKRCARHEVSAEYESLPESVKKLPNGTDLMVTFATGSVATMAVNWVRTVYKAGISDLLVGALDAEMMEVCAREKIPCVHIQGGAVSQALSSRRDGNVRADPKLYPKMSVLKVGFYRELLSFGFNVWACDADALFMHDPRPLMRADGFEHADVAIATDCIDIPGDSRRPLLHCDFNTGLVYLRSNAKMLAFTDRWRETVANAMETRIRDQAAFNMLTKSKTPAPFKAADGAPVPRVFSVTDGAGGHFELGVLPLSRFMNGHTFFVQHAHTLPAALPAMSVHMTYQFGEGRSFAYGKRQRLRHAGLWFVDDDSYFSGKYITAGAGANLALREFGPHADSRDAVKYHMEEARHRSKVMRALFGIGKALGREVILPRLLCYCDFMWKEMKACRVGGAESMRLPFDCPMDHVFDTPRFFGDFKDGVETPNALGVGVREPEFLTNPRVPSRVSGSVVNVSIGTGMDDAAVVRALEPYKEAGVIVLDDVIGAFCGFKDAELNALFERETTRMLSYTRTPFCTMEGSDNAPLFSNCCSPRKPGEKFFPCTYGFDPPEQLPACAAA